MMRQIPGFVQLGIGLVVLGVVVKLALMLAGLFGPLANIAIGAGVVIAIIGLVMPRKR